MSDQFSNALEQYTFTNTQLYECMMALATNTLDGQQMTATERVMLIERQQRYIVMKELNGAKITVLYAFEHMSREGL